MVEPYQYSVRKHLEVTDNTFRNMALWKLLCCKRWEKHVVLAAKDFAINRVLRRRSESEEFKRSPKPPHVRAPTIVFIMNIHITVSAQRTKVYVHYGTPQHKSTVGQLGCVNALAAQKPETDTAS